MITEMIMMVTTTIRITHQTTNKLENNTLRMIAMVMTDENKQSNKHDRDDGKLQGQNFFL